MLELDLLAKRDLEEQTIYSLAEGESHLSN